MLISNQLCIVRIAMNVVYLPSVFHQLGSPASFCAKISSNDGFDIICGDLGLPVLNFSYALQASERHVVVVVVFLRGISGSDGLKTLVIKNYALLNKKNV